MRKAEVALQEIIQKSIEYPDFLQQKSIEYPDFRLAHHQQITTPRRVIISD